MRANLTDGFLGIEDLKSVPLEDIIIVREDGGQQFSYLGNHLFTNTNNQFVPIHSYYDMLSAYENGTLWGLLPNAEHHTLLTKANSKFTTRTMQQLVSSRSAKPTYITSRYSERATTLSTGLVVRRLMDVEGINVTRVSNLFASTADSGENLYLKVGDDWGYYPKSNIYYLDGGEYKKAIGVSFTADQLQRTEFFLNSGEDATYLPIAGILTTKAFDLTPHTEEVRNEDGTVTGKTESFEEADFDSFKLKQFEEDESGRALLDINGNPVYETTDLERFYTENEYKAVGKQQRIEVTNYQIEPNATGEFLRLRLKGVAEPVLVSVKPGANQLFISRDGTRIPVAYDPQDATNSMARQIIGKELTVVLDGRSYLTESVQPEEAISTYSTMKRMVQNQSRKNRLSDNSYIRLANGKYVKENQFVRPIAYNFVADQTTNVYDAYLVYYTDTDGSEKSVVVGKAEIDRGARKISRNGKTIDIDRKNAYKIVRSRFALSGSAIIQTTNLNNSFEDAVTLVKKPENDTSVLVFQDDADALLKTAKAKFREEYVAGRYDVDEIMLDGEIVPIDGTARYSYTDKYEIDNPEGNKTVNKFLKSGQTKFNPLTGKFEGGPKFDMGKANWSWFENVGKVLVAPTVFGLASLGIFSALISPLAIPVVLGALGVGWFSGPLVNLVRKIVNVTGNQKFKDMSDKSREATKKQIVERLQTLQDSVLKDCKNIDTKVEKDVLKIKNQLISTDQNQKEQAQAVCAQYGVTIGDNIDDACNQLRVRMASKLKEPIKARFLDSYNSIYFNIVSLSKAKYKSKFEMKDNVGVVNLANASIYSECKGDLKKKRNELFSLQKKLKKDPENTELKGQVDILKGELDNLGKSLTRDGIFKDIDPKRDSLFSLAEQVKGAVLIKGGLLNLDNEIKDSENKRITSKLNLLNLVYRTKFSAKKQEMVSAKKQDKLTKSEKETLEKALRAVSSKAGKYDYSKSENVIEVNSNSDNIMDIAQEETVQVQRQNVAEQTAQSQAEQVAQTNANNTTGRTVRILEGNAILVFQVFVRRMKEFIDNNDYLTDNWDNSTLEKYNDFVEFFAENKEIFDIGLEMLRNKVATEVGGYKLDQLNEIIKNFNEKGKLVDEKLSAQFARNEV